MMIFFATAKKIHHNVFTFAHKGENISLAEGKYHCEAISRGIAAYH